MSDADRARRRFRRLSHPAVGAVVGLVAAASSHLFHLSPGTPFRDAIASLFATAPVVGYVAFAGIGAALAWTLRRAAPPA